MPRNEPVRAMVTRRRFLGQACAAGGAAAVGLTLPAACGAAADASRSVYDLAAANWRALIGEPFLVQPATAGRPATRLVLREVRATDHSRDAHRPLGLRPESVSLVFEAEGPRSLENATHRMSHPALGEFALLVQRTGAPSRSDRRRFEAVMN